LYQTARLNPRVRAFLVDEAIRLGVSQAARRLGVSRRTVYRWRRRAPDFADRSSRPHRSPRRCSDVLEARVLAVRLTDRVGPDWIAPLLGMHASTVHRVLRRHAAHRLGHLFPKPPRSFGSFAPLRPGELVGIDIKSFGSLERGGGRRYDMHRNNRRKVGWRHLHVAIDMASRLAFTEFRSGLAGADGVAFLSRATAFFAAHGIRVERVLTDNGSAFCSQLFAESCRAAGIRHTRTRPKHPWTNGRAERFIGTIQRECAYREQFTSDAARDLSIALFVPWYNTQRPHAALGGLAPQDWLDRWRVTHLSGDLS
jgi:transposase InsO family protein